MTELASSPAPAGTPAVPALRLSQIRKAFGPIRALDVAEVTVRSGSVHALLGGNGSGKSTMLRALAGVDPADSGVVHIGASRHDASRFNPELARGYGFRFVHQASSVFPDLSVLDNLALGRGYQRRAGGRIAQGAERATARSVLDRFGIKARPDDQVGDLSAASQTLLAIARAMQDFEDGAGVLFLDEPTACLPGREAKLLLAAVREMSLRGQTVVLVSHRLDEVLAVADHATVLADGQVRATFERGVDLEHDGLVDAIVGPGRGTTLPTSALARHTPSPGSAPVAKVHGLRSGPVRRADLEIRAGEIVGVAGLLGSGRSTLLRSIFGAAPRSGGVLHVGGSTVRPGDIRAAMRAGIALVPENRHEEGAFEDLSVRANLTVTTMRAFWRGGRLRKAAETSAAAAAVEAYGIKTAEIGATLGTLSGGNQQKVILARWMARQPALLLLDEPTQGVDIGARDEIHELIRRAVAARAAALVVSSDFEELALLCHRVLVLADGELSPFDGQLEADAIGRAAHGFAGCEVQETRWMS